MQKTRPTVLPQILPVWSFKRLYGRSNWLSRESVAGTNAPFSERIRPSLSIEAQMFPLYSATRVRTASSASPAFLPIVSNVPFRPRLNPVLVETHIAPSWPSANPLILSPANPFRFVQLVNLSPPYRHKQFARP